MFIYYKTIVWRISAKLLLFSSLFIFIFPNHSFAQTDSTKEIYSFIEAADRGDVKAVNSYINKGVNINCRDANGGTPLFYAANNSHLEVIKTLLYYGADPNIGTMDGFTPLMNVSAQGNFKTAQLLLYDSRTKLDIIDINKCTALHYASYYDNIYIVDMLLFYGANAQLKARNSSSPLLLASFSGDTALAQLLINAGNLIKSFDTKGNSPMSIAIQNNDTVLFDFYFEKINNEVKEDKDWNSYLLTAIQHNNDYATNKLLDFFQKGVFELTDSKKLINQAYKLENYGLVAKFYRDGYKSSYKPIFNAAHFKFSESFNNTDYISYFAFGIDEVRYNISASIIYGTRFTTKAILNKIDENTFYQYLEHRNVLGFYLRKNIVFIPLKDIIIKPYIGAAFQWHFISYNGILQKQPTSFIFVPEFGVSFKYQLLLVDISYQYGNFKLYDVSPHRINVGIGINIPFYNKTKKYYPLWL